MGSPKPFQHRQRHLPQIALAIAVIAVSANGHSTSVTADAEEAPSGTDAVGTPAEEDGFLQFMAAPAQSEAATSILIAGECRVDAIVLSQDFAVSEVAGKPRPVLRFPLRVISTDCPVAPASVIAFSPDQAPPIGRVTLGVTQRETADFVVLSHKDSADQPRESADE